MMLLHGFKTKADLKARVADKSRAGLVAEAHIEETSIFGRELRPNGTFCVCMDHPKRTKFANVTVANGLITTVR